jgi:hypothetical protein
MNYIMEDYVVRSHKELGEVAVEGLEDGDGQTEFEHLDASYYRNILENWKVNEKHMDDTFTCKSPIVAMAPIHVAGLTLQR